MAKKICNRLQWCYPDELITDDKWKELALRSDAEYSIDVRQLEAGHLEESTVNASIVYDAGHPLVSNAYRYIILKGFTTDGSSFILGSELNPVLVEYDHNKEAVNFEFSHNQPL